MCTASSLVGIYCIIAFAVATLLLLQQHKIPFFHSPSQILSLLRSQVLITPITPTRDLASDRERCNYNKTRVTEILVPRKIGYPGYAGFRKGWYSAVNLGTLTRKVTWQTRKEIVVLGDSLSQKSTPT